MAVVAFLMSGYCNLALASKGPCPDGQELREEKHPDGTLKSKGCVDGAAEVVNVNETVGFMN
jgi:hypothetical protein